MARTDTTLDEILTQVVARLRDQISDANDSTCYLSMDPNDLRAPNSGEFIYVVTPATSGRFDDGAFDGGGQSMTTVNWPIVVTVHSLAMLDETGRDASFITHATLGIVAKGTNILKALAGHDLQDAEDVPSEILDQPIFPSDAALDRSQPEKGKGLMQFGFMVVFDWDLS